MLREGALNAGWSEKKVWKDPQGGSAATLGEGMWDGEGSKEGAGRAKVQGRDVSGGHQDSIKGMLPNTLTK